MRISKIKKFAPSPNTLFIGTDANTGDTYNFLGSYVSGNARGDFYSNNVQGASSATINTNYLIFHEQNDNLVCGFKTEEDNLGDPSALKALKSGIFNMSLCLNTRAGSSETGSEGNFGIWIRKGDEINTTVNIPNSGKRSFIPNHYTNTQLFNWLIKVDEGDFVRFQYTYIATDESSPIGIYPIQKSGVIPSSNSVHLIINEVQI